MAVGEVGGAVRGVLDGVGAGEGDGDAAAEVLHGGGGEAEAVWAAVGGGGGGDGVGGGGGAGGGGGGQGVGGGGEGDGGDGAARHLLAAQDAYGVLLRVLVQNLQRATGLTKRKKQLVKKDRLASVTAVLQNHPARAC